MPYNSEKTPTAPDHRLEEAEVRLVAKQEANALLNSQVDLLTKQLQELQEGKAAYEKHFKDLSALLAKERRQHAPHPKQVHIHSTAHKDTARTTVSVVTWSVVTWSNA